MEDDGSLIPGGEGKSKLMNILGKSHEIKPPRQFNVEKVCHVLDGMFIVNKMVPKCNDVKTGNDLVNIFTSYIDSLTQKSETIHIVFDTYKNKSLKNMTRKIRKKDRKSAAYRVTSSSNLSKTPLKKLLLNDESKGYLATFLAEEVSKFFLSSGKKYMVSYDNKTVGNLGYFDNNNHEEADSMIIYHTIDASKYSYRVIVHSSDTDVFVCLVSHSSDINSECWMCISSETVYDVKSVFMGIGPKKSKGLVALHVITGCDITGRFRGKTKKTWLEFYLNADEETLDYFVNFPLTNNPLENIKVLKVFLCSVFCKGTNISDLGNARWFIWTQTKSIEKLPPTFGAFVQAVKRAWYASKIFEQGHTLMQNTPNPLELGWRLTNDEFEPITSDDPIAPDSVVELISCGCKGACKSKRCSCRKVDVCCTDLCSCNDACENSDPPLDKRNIGET